MAAAAAMTVGRAVGLWSACYTPAATLQRAAPPLRRLAAGRHALASRRGVAVVGRPLVAEAFPRVRRAVGARVVASAAAVSADKKDAAVKQQQDSRLAALREQMSKAGVDAYIIPTEDAHASEYSALRYARRAFITRFTGSAGTAVVTKEKAALWTDGRYFLQASQQLGSQWTLMRAGQPGVPDMAAWLTDVLPSGSSVGIDPFLHSATAARELLQNLEEHGCTLLPLPNGNLVDAVWGEDMPAAPDAELRVHPVQYAGQTVEEKLQSVRGNMKETGAGALVVSMLDEVAWLYNLRGGDVPHCPVTYAYAVVTASGASLYVDKGKVTPEVAEHLQAAGVSVLPYDTLLVDIKQLAASSTKLWMDLAKVSFAVFATAESGSEDAKKKEKAKERRKMGSPNGVTDGGDIVRASPVIASTSPITMAKATKNEAELEGMRKAHLRDAAALANFWAWLEAAVTSGEQLTEVCNPAATNCYSACNASSAAFEQVYVGERLEQFRREQEGFLDTSFDTIAGSGPNGAIIHYRAEEGTCRIVDDKFLFLLDSGGQYTDGTTDITRTAHFGTPTDREKECFTRVLQGHIALDSAVFPERTPGFVLDAFARASLWSAGLDYRHGTGHGVGAALNVHEGPQGISARYGNQTPLAAGMIVSNEPGYYEDGAFGIRIENLLVVKEANTPNRFGGTTYFDFERLTFCPIQTKLLALEIMSESEVQWLNAYHTQVWEKVSPLIQGDALEWLRRNTQPVAK
eukprot:jgi/Chlat1/621/Chrsp103S08590